MDLAEKAGARRPSIVTVLTKLTQGINSAKSQCSRRTSDANHATASAEVPISEAVAGSKLHTIN